MPKLNMVQAINLGLKQEMAGDDSVILLGEDIGVDGGVFRVTDGLLEAYGAERVLDTPLAESGIVGTSIGMAMAGLRPVAEMQFSGFSLLAFAQLEGHASRFRARTHGQQEAVREVKLPRGIHAAREEQADAGDHPHADHYYPGPIPIQCPTADDGKQHA